MTTARCNDRPAFLQTLSAIACLTVLLTLVGCCRFGACGGGACGGGSCGAISCGATGCGYECDTLILPEASYPGCSPSCSAPSCVAPPTCLVPTCSTPTFSTPTCAAGPTCAMPAPITCAAPVYETCDACTPCYDDCLGCGPKIFRKPNWLRRLFGGPCRQHGCGVCCGSAMFGGYDSCDCSGFITAYTPQFHSVTQAQSGATMPLVSTPAVNYETQPSIVPVQTPQIHPPQLAPQQMPQQQMMVPPMEQPSMAPAAEPMPPVQPPIQPSYGPTPPAVPRSLQPSRTLPPADLTPLPADPAPGVPNLNTSQTDTHDYRLPSIRQVVYERHIPVADLEPSDRTAESLPRLTLPSHIHASGKRTSRQQSEQFDNQFVR